MNAYMLDRTGLVFFSFALVVACFAVFDTHRLFRWLSFGRKTMLTRVELLSIRIPGTVVIAGILWSLGVTLLWKH